MGRALNRMRDKLSRRATAQAKAAPPVISDVQINYGVADGKVCVSFNAPIAVLAMTPEQCGAMQEMLTKCIEALK